MMNCPSILQRTTMKGTSNHANLSLKETGRKHIIHEKRLTMNTHTQICSIVGASSYGI